jgi:predicted nucleic acid-binding protein
MDVRLTRFVLDTNAVLYLLGGRLAQPLPAGDYFISVISELELLAYPNITEDEEKRIKALLEDVTIIEFPATVKKQAIDLRKRHNLKLPDAIIAATALSLSATLLTNDQRLLALTEIPTQGLQVLSV